MLPEEAAVYFGGDRDVEPDPSVKVPAFLVREDHPREAVRAAPGAEAAARCPSF